MATPKKEMSQQEQLQAGVETLRQRVGKPTYTTDTTETPGVSSYEYADGAVGKLQSVFDWVRVAKERPEPKDVGYSLRDTIDNQSRPPMWMETRDMAIDGSPLSEEEKGKDWYEHKYAKEFTIAEVKVHMRREQEYFERNDIAGYYKSAMQAMGMWPEAPNLEQHEDIGARLHELRERQLVEAQEKKQMDWKAFVSALEGDKPLAVVARQYRNVYDVYGLDQWLDSSVAVLWMACKVGTFIGLNHGGLRAIKALHADVQYTKVSGIGALTFLNVTMIAGIIKWAGNVMACSTAFLLGDRLTKAVKYAVLPADVAAVRSPANYSVGCSCAFGTVGILPWWLLNDARLGLRLMASGLVIGAGIGLAAGYGVQNLVAMSLSRLQYTPAEFRNYVALMKREKLAMELTLDRLKRSRDYEPDATSL